MTALILFLKKWMFYAIGFIFVLSLVYISGCNRGKRVKICPTITTTTVIRHDTIVHNIVDSFPYYIQGETKTIYVDVPANVDTAFILREYFATHEFNRIWQDSLVEVTLKDFISQNKPVDNVFNYKIKRPQTITYTTVDNSVNYARYIYFGASLPIYPAKVNNVSNINLISLNGIYAFKKGYAELNYQPYTKIFTLGAGIRLLKFK